MKPIEQYHASEKVHYNQTDHLQHLSNPSYHDQKNYGSKKYIQVIDHLNDHHVAKNQHLKPLKYQGQMDHFQLGMQPNQDWTEQQYKRSVAHIEADDHLKQINQPTQDWQQDNSIKSTTHIESKDHLQLHGLQPIQQQHGS